MAVNSLDNVAGSPVANLIWVPAPVPSVVSSNNKLAMRPTLISNGVFPLPTVLASLKSN